MDHPPVDPPVAPPVDPAEPGQIPHMETGPEAGGGAAGDGLWYLAQLRPNQLARARRNLERQGYRCFVPLRPATQRSGRQLRTRLAPLFPGYLFLALGPAQAWRPVNGTFGVVRLVMRDAITPQPVPPAVMAQLFAHSDAEGVLAPPADLAPGDAVRVHAGPMAGFVARVAWLDGPGRVGVLLDMMGQAVRATLPIAHAERLAG